MRQKEHLSLIGVYRDALVLHVIRFASEIRDPTRLNLPDEKISKRELEMAKSLIEQYSEKFEFEKYNDVYNDQLDRKSTRLNSSHVAISYAVFCLKKNNIIC